MKKLRWVLFIILLGVLLLLLWHWRSSQLAPLSTDLTPPAAATSQKSQPAPASSAASVPTTMSPQVAPATPPIGKREQMANLLSAVNHKPIEFYGKVVDQHGAPLVGVGVYASVIYNSGLSAGVDKKQTETDAAGLFSITGMKGRTLGIGLDKNGYEYGGDHGPFQFTEMVAESERYHPDAEKPVVFVMWKLQGAEPMIHFERKAFKLPPDGTPVRIDLTTGKRVSSGGDLVVTLQQPMAQSGQWLQHYAWSAQVMADGLIESTAKLMYSAPDNGYVPVLTYGEKGDERLQNATVERSFYLKTSDGRFARVKMDLTSQTNPAFPSTVGLAWWLNPKSGSRNLEFDPAKAITPKP